ncbi:MAG: hypothetical protein PHH22_03295 [Clostridia bacterium]|nr:hypothetical protein [Clostridia bacterium]
MSSIINNIRYAFVGIWKNRMLSLLLILQLIVCFVFFVQFINLYNEINERSNVVLRQYDTNGIYFLKCQQEEIKDRLKDKSFEELEKIETGIKSFINNSKSFSILVCKNDIFSMPLNNKMQNLNLNSQNVIIKDSNEKIVNLNVLDVPSYTINMTYLDRFGLNIKKGRNFDIKEFDLNSFTEVIPIIVGSNWEKYYDVGDVISIYNVIKGENVFRKIVGILEKDAKLFLHSYYTQDYIEDINNIIILPQLDTTEYMNKYEEYITQLNISYDKNALKIEEIVNLFNVLIVSQNNATKDEIYEEFNKELETLKLNTIDLETIEDRFIVEKESTQRLMQQNQFVFILLFIFSFIGITITFIVCTNMRLKEYAIHILNGSTKKDIYIRIFWELFIINIISIIFAIAYINVELYSQYVNIPQSENFIYFAPRYMMPSLLLNIGIIVMVIISSVIPIIKLKNTDISNILKGDD